MAKLYFRYGTMGSSKTANALMARYNYMERGNEVILLKPRMECRDGEKVIKSRIGLSCECKFVEEFIAFAENYWLSERYDALPHPSPRAYAAVIVDEAQFLTAKQVDFLAEIVDMFGIPVLCYGLRTDFRGNFFEGSQRLMEIADVIEEVPTVCWCGKRAQFNARISNGKIIKHGDQIMFGGNETYTSLCRKHYMLNMPFKK